jgi:FdhD protein
MPPYLPVVVQGIMRQQETVPIDSKPGLPEQPAADGQADEPVRFQRYAQGRWETVVSRIVREAPVSLTVNGEVWLTFMCTPTDLKALAAGFLFNEGLIQSAAELANLSVCASGDNVDVWLTHIVDRPTQWKRTTGCSGGVTAVETAPSGPAFAPGDPLAPEAVGRLMGRLIEAQELYKTTRGVHSSALTDGDAVWVQVEDIGRHNTLDKIAGRVLLEGIAFERRILVTTGRISSEMLQKAARLGAPLVISRTSPNTLSIQTAREQGITLIGYGRRDAFQIYTHPERIVGAPAGDPSL